MGDNGKTTKGRQGFASMTPEQHREIASLGGRSVPKAKRSFSRNNELACSAGRKGGASTPAEKRAFSRSADLAVAAGRKGGASVSPEKRPFSTDRSLAVEAGRKGGLAKRNKPGQL